MYSRNGNSVSWWSSDKSPNFSWIESKLAKTILTQRWKQASQLFILWRKFLLVLLIYGHCFRPIKTTKRSSLHKNQHSRKHDFLVLRSYYSQDSLDVQKINNKVRFILIPSWFFFTVFLTLSLLGLGLGSPF